MHHGKWWILSVGSWSVTGGLNDSLDGFDLILVIINFFGVIQFEPIERDNTSYSIPCWCQHLLCCEKWSNIPLLGLQSAVEAKSWPREWCQKAKGRYCKGRKDSGLCCIWGELILIRVSVICQTFLEVCCPCCILNACSWCLPFGCWFHSPIDIWNCCGEPDWTFEDSFYMEIHCSQPFYFDCPDVHFVVLWTGYSERPAVCAENMQRAQYIRSPWSACWTSGVWWKVLHRPWGYSWLQVNRTP